MLEQKDLEAIANLIDSRISKSENLILDELERQTSRIDNEMKAIRKNLEELEQYYKITKLENDNTKILLQLIESLRNDVEELKKKIA